MAGGSLIVFLFGKDDKRKRKRTAKQKAERNVISRLFGRFAYQQQQQRNCSDTIALACIASFQCSELTPSAIEMPLPPPSPLPHDCYVKEMPVATTSNARRFDPLLDDELVSASQRAFVAKEKSEWGLRPYLDSTAPARSVTENMRAVVVDWMFQVLLDIQEEEGGSKRRVHTRTAVYATRHLDCFLSLRDVSRGELQLLAIACLDVALKVEHALERSLDYWQWLSDETYAAKRVHAMQWRLLDVLGWQVVPTIACDLHVAWVHVALHSIARLSERCSACLLSTTEAFILTATNDYATSTACRPSLVAAASLSLAISTLVGAQHWSQALRSATGYSKDELQATTTLILAAYRRVEARTDLEATHAACMVPERPCWCGAGAIINVADLYDK